MGSSSGVGAFSGSSSSSSSSSIMSRSSSSRCFFVFRPAARALGWGTSSSSSPSSDITCMLESSPLGVAGLEVAAGFSFLGIDAALEKACIIPELEDPPRLSAAGGFFAGAEDAGVSASLDA